MSADFVKIMQRRYRGGRDRLFILHGNVSDLFPTPDTTGIKLQTLPDHIFRRQTLDPKKLGGNIWIHYSLSTGSRWINGKESNGAARVSKLFGSEGDSKVTFTRAPLDFFRLFEEACRRHEKDESTEKESAFAIPLRIIITDAHLIVPEAQTSFMRPEDRELLVLLKRFASEPAYDDSNTMVVLVSDVLSGIHRELREVGVSLEISRPSEKEIAEHIDWSLAASKATVDEEDISPLKRLAIGLSRRQVENVVAETVAAGEKLTKEVLSARRKELTGRDYGEYLEFFEPTWNLDQVGGSREAVAELCGLAEALKRGDRDIPTGIILVGQNGIGKTFLAKALLGTAAITGVVLKPFQDSALGASERNWEKIAGALRSAGQIGILVDEADAQMGNRSGPNVHEVSKRIFAMQMQLMGNPVYRGKIFWILMTCRPDKLAPDVKRPGRCDRIISLFPTSGSLDAEEMLKAQVEFLARSDGFQFDSSFAKPPPEEILRQLVKKTGGQMDQLLRRAKKLADKSAIGLSHVCAVLKAQDSFARTEPEAYTLQRYLAIEAAVETENSDLIPAVYKAEVENLGGIPRLKSKIVELRDRLDYA